MIHQNDSPTFSDEINSSAAVLISFSHTDFTQTTILSALLYGCEIWYINREDIKELTDIQYIIIRTILKLPVSTPKPRRN